MATLRVLAKSVPVPLHPMKNKSTSQRFRHSPGQGGFLNLRVVIGLFIALAGVLLAVLGFGTFSNVSAQPKQEPDGQGAGQMKVIHAVHSDLSPPLRDQ